MGTEHRVTQRDIALRAKVDRATVSLALRNHPSIPAKTRERIQAIAGELGYAPDPMLAALAAYRSRTQTSSYHGTLAWLSNSDFGFDWRSKVFFIDYYNAAVDRAKQLGYHIEEFDIKAPDMTPRRLASILRARNISGMLVAPQPKPDTEIEFPWEQFSAVKFGYSLTRPELHTFATTHYRNAIRTMKEIYALGYRRVGLAFSQIQERRLDHSFLAAYLAEEYQEHNAINIPPFTKERTEKNTPHFLAWLREYKPDVLVTGSVGMKDLLAELGYRVPEDIGLALCGMARPHQGFAGVVEDSRRVGEVAIDFLVSMIQHGERGIPRVPQRTLVEGYWVDGETLPPLPASKVARTRKSSHPASSD